MVAITSLDSVPSRLLVDLAVRFKTTPEEVGIALTDMQCPDSSPSNENSSAAAKFRARMAALSLRAALSAEEPLAHA